MIFLKEALKTMGSYVLGIIIFIAIGLLIAFIIKGSLWFSVRIFPWMATIFWIVIALTIIILVPLSIIKKTRDIGLGGIFITSYIYGLLLWVWSFLITYSTWGWIAIIIGLVVMGVGVVPIAFLAALLNAQWTILLQMIILIAITYGTRLLVNFIAEKSEIS